MLLDRQDASIEQQELALDEGPPDRSALMETMDRAIVAPATTGVGATSYFVLSSALFFIGLTSNVACSLPTTARN